MTNWRVILPGAAATLIGAGIGVEAATQDVAAAYSVGLFIIGSILVGAWLVLLAREKD